MENLARMMQGKPTQPKAKKKSALRGEATAESLTRAVERYLDGKEGSGTKKITGFHPSYGYKCKRRWVLLFRGVDYDKKHNSRTQRIFDNGNEVHARWRGYFAGMGILIGAEVDVNVNEPVPIRGHADGILEWGGRKLYELKSISPTRFEFRRMYRKPDEKTMEQAQIYLFALNLDVAYVIYENKGTQEVLIFYVEKDMAIINRVLKRWEKTYKFFQEGVIPPRPYKRDSDDCNFCDLQRVCWDEMDD